MTPSLAYSLKANPTTRLCAKGADLSGLWPAAEWWGNHVFSDPRNAGLKAGRQVMG